MSEASLFGTLCIRTDWGSRIGIGHVMRCIALAQAWKDRGGLVVFATTSTSTDVLRRLSTEGFEVHTLRSYLGSASDARETAQVAHQKNATWIVLDGYQFTPDFHREVKKSGINVLTIDDLGCIERCGSSVILNPNLYAPSLAYASRERQTRTLLGPRYALLRREFAIGRQPTLPPVKPHVENLLITLGGADPQNITYVILGIFAREALPIRLNIKVVIGSENTHFASLNELRVSVERNHNLEFARQPSDMCELMRNADFAISASSGSALEVASVGTPMALVIAADNQRKVATSFEEAGAALSLSDSERAIRPERFQELLELLRTPERLECMRKAGLQMVDGLGAGRVAEVMVSHPLRLRSAKEDDAKLIFDWANEPVTRQMSFSTNEISWKSHLRWFKNQITSSDCRSLIAVNSDGEPVGQVRLTREDYSAVLSISIDPKERGKGYAPKIARLAAAEALTENWCTEVRALVKSENVASVKTFLKAGFRQRGFRLDESKSTVIFTMSTIDFLSQS